MSDTPPRVLYVTYDGALEALGESQVVAYLERLADAYDITLLSFEKPADLAGIADVARMRHRLAQARIRWIPLRYHKWPPVLSTAYDVCLGLARAYAWAFAGRRGFVHARSYVPALIASGVRTLAGTRFLFDMRGFWPDEKVDAGHWRAGSLMHRIAKRCERRFFERADAIVSLTDAGVAQLGTMGYDIPHHTPIEVIPTCTDLDRFAPAPKNAGLASRLGLAGRRVVGTTGTLSNSYMRDATLAAFARLTRHLPDVSVLIVTREDHDRLRADAAAAGVPQDRLVLTTASFADMPEYVRLMDLGLFFIKPRPSKQGASATKLGEFLACGVPVVVNEGVGDSDRIVRACEAGVVVPNPPDAALADALPAIERLLADPAARVRCRSAAVQFFSLERGVAAYARLYALLSMNGARAASRA